jgi:hypothetical protein
MSNFENLLVPGSTELPDCRCGTEMRLVQAKPLGEAEIRVFKCDKCGHELQLTVWKAMERRAPAPGSI